MPTVLPQISPPIYENLTAWENMKVRALLLGIPDEKIQKVLKTVDLTDTGKKKAGAFSLGMKQRLGIAAAVFEQPDIILLDEPTNALDESGITMLENVIQDETSRGATIVMASHDMNFLHHCCSKIYTMRAGTLSL